MKQGAREEIGYAFCSCFAAACTNLEAARDKRSNNATPKDMVVVRIRCVERLSYVDLTSVTDRTSIGPSQACSVVDRSTKIA